LQVKTLFITCRKKTALYQTEWAEKEKGKKTSGTPRAARAYGQNADCGKLLTCPL
jgi:hypothetical protein